MNKNKKKTVEYGKYGLLFIAPFFIVFLVFQFYPLLYTIFKSFMFDKKTGRKKVTTVFGLGNYINYVFGGNGEVWQAMLITIVLWLLNFIPQLLLSLLLAAWFTDMQFKLKGQGAYKVIMYMPNIITAATIAVLFYSLFDVHGSLTEILRHLGLAGDEGILTKGWWSLFIIAFIQFWMWYGNTMIVLIAGPLLKPILQFTMVTSAIGGLQMYDIPQLFNEGKPLVNVAGTTVQSTRTIVMLIKSYINAGPSQNYGRASAYSVVLFVITLAVSMIFYKLTSEKN